MILVFMIFVILCRSVLFAVLAGIRLRLVDGASKYYGPQKNVSCTTTEKNEAVVKSTRFWSFG